MKSEKELIKNNGVQRQPKTFYITPKLIVYGDLEMITRGSGSSQQLDLPFPGAGTLSS